MHRQKFKDTLSNKVRNSQTWYPEIKEENVLPKTPANANTLSNMVETKIYERVSDLDANRSKGHGEVRQWERLPIGNGKTMLFEIRKV